MNRPDGVAVKIVVGATAVRRPFTGGAIQQRNVTD
jgi:hypothetical protein